MISKFLIKFLVFFGISFHCLTSFSCFLTPFVTCFALFVNPYALFSLGIWVRIGVRTSRSSSPFGWRGSPALWPVMNGLCVENSVITVSLPNPSVDTNAIFYAIDFAVIPLNVGIRDSLPIGFRDIQIVSEWVFIFYFTSVMYLETEEKIYSLIRLIVFNIVWVAFVTETCAIFWLGFCIWILSALYFKFKFNEINDKIVLSLKQSNISRLMYDIYERNFVECLTWDMNEIRIWFSKMLWFFLSS